MIRVDGLPTAPKDVAISETRRSLRSQFNISNLTAINYYEAEKPFNIGLEDLTAAVSIFRDVKALKEKINDKYRRLQHDPYVAYPLAASLWFQLYESGNNYDSTYLEPADLAVLVYVDLFTHGDDYIDGPMRRDAVQEKPTFQQFCDEINQKSQYRQLIGGLFNSVGYTPNTTEKLSKEYQSARNLWMLAEYDGLTMNHPMSFTRAVDQVIDTSIVPALVMADIINSNSSAITRPRSEQADGVYLTVLATLLDHVLDVGEDSQANTLSLPLSIAYEVGEYDDLVSHIRNKPDPNSFVLNLVTHRHRFPKTISGILSLIDNLCNSMQTELGKKVASSLKVAILTYPQIAKREKFKMRFAGSNPRI